MKYILDLSKLFAVAAVVTFSVPQFASADSMTLDDATLAGSVSEKLMDSTELDATSLIVTSEDGVVHIRGTVQEEGEAEAAKVIAESVPGVERVETHISIGEWGH